MATVKISPYLQFNGAAEQAIRLYERALGAKTRAIMRFTDGPGMEVPPEHKDRVMHSELEIGDYTLMVSDSMPNEPLQMGTNVEVCLNFDDIADMTAKFDALAVGGTIRLPLQDTFWGARFGLVTDAFGGRWMFNCMLDKK